MAQCARRARSCFRTERPSWPRRWSASPRSPWMDCWSRWKRSPSSGDPAADDLDLTLAHRPDEAVVPVVHQCDHRRERGGPAKQREIAPVYATEDSHEHDHRRERREGEPGAILEAEAALNVLVLRPPDDRERGERDRRNPFSARSTARRD